MPLVTAPPLPQLNADENALLLDVDGTLLDIAATPEDVVVPAGLVDTLAQLREKLNGALAILSGRNISSIDSLFTPERFPVAGCHGAELRGADGSLVAAAPIPRWVLDLTETIYEIAPGVLIENKLAALSIHYRLIPEFGDIIVQRVGGWRDRLAQAGYALLPGKFVVDIKPAEVSKGTAARKLMAQLPFAGRKPIFFGDDLTDAEVLAVLPEFAGTGVSVGREMKNADYRFGTPSDVHAWLAAQLARNA